MEDPNIEAEKQFRFQPFRTSLRARVALGVALPVLVLLTSLVMVNYWRERRRQEDQIRLTALQLGEIMKGSLRYAMLVNDCEMVANIVNDVGSMENIEQVQIINIAGEVRVSSQIENQGTVRQPDDVGCRECHQIPTESRPNTVNLSSSLAILRVATLIPNEPDCYECHDDQSPILGALLADVSLVDIEGHLRETLRVDAVFSIGITLLVTAVVYLLINRTVVRRVETFRHPLAEFAAGDFSSRLPAFPPPTDALGKLANAFNHMADELERHEREREERSQVRQRAIVEERERIARELHDGLAQLLGYVNTKAMAVRLMLQKQQVDAASKHLEQLEEAARELFVDVREAILDLKMEGRLGASLTTTLNDFTAQFSRFSGLPVDLDLAPALDELPLPAETELQLLRIVQESLTNVRKHASATQVWICIQIDAGMLKLEIRDDGQGFDPKKLRSNNRPHLGLSSMRERAEAIGAEFNLLSAPGAGTLIKVHVGLEEENARTGS
ncbi:MAG: ATP-binding protein [Chloroflexota bacterium]